LALLRLCWPPPACAGDENEPAVLEIIIISQSWAVRNNDGFLESLTRSASSNACWAHALVLCWATMSSSLTDAHAFPQ
jgi:hypothetical protein